VNMHIHIIGSSRYVKTDGNSDPALVCSRAKKPFTWLIQTLGTSLGAAVPACVHAAVPAAREMGETDQSGGESEIHVIRRFG
jgi:hypothetical protein